MGWARSSEKGLKERAEREISARLRMDFSLLLLICQPYSGMVVVMMMMVIIVMAVVMVVMAEVLTSSDKDE